MITRVLLVVAMAVMLGWQPAKADRNNLVIDLVDEPSSLDPHVQWNPDSYYVYRNIFDNLLTRDDQGQIAPRIATAWRDQRPESNSTSARALGSGAHSRSTTSCSRSAVINPEFAARSSTHRCGRGGERQVRIAPAGPTVLPAQLVVVGRAARPCRATATRNSTATRWAAAPLRARRARGAGSQRRHWGGRPPSCASSSTPSTPRDPRRRPGSRAGPIVPGSDEARQLQTTRAAGRWSSERARVDVPHDHARRPTRTSGCARRSASRSTAS